MCRFCEEPCWRDGGERDCELSDAEFDEAANDEDTPDWQDEDFPLPPSSGPRTTGEPKHE